MKQAPLAALVVLILLVAGGSLFYISSRKNNSSFSSPTPSANAIEATSSPASGWKTYKNDTLNFEFQYPQDWQYAEPKINNQIVTTNISSPNGLIIDLQAGPPGIGGRCNNPTNTDLGHDTLSILNQPFNLFYFGNKAQNTISYAYVISGNKPCPNIPYFDIPYEIEATGGLKFKPLGNIKIHYYTDKPMQVSEFQNKDLQNAKTILQSAKFTK